MFYVGYFSWEGPEPEARATARPQATFTCFVEADSVDEAGEKLRKLIVNLKSWTIDFDNVEVVRFDDLIEITKLPEQGVLARFEEVAGDEGTISAMLPAVSPEFCETYSLRKDDERGSRRWNNNPGDVHILRG